jgi:hypothetical protein
MKRRTFVMISLYGGVAMVVPSFGCHSKNDLSSKSWIRPYGLSHICDAKTLKAIGEAYMKKVTDENDQQKLVRLILSDSSHNILSSASPDSTIENLIKRKTDVDFAKGNTVTVNGWVLSQTEARQCALFAIVNQ